MNEISETTVAAALEEARGVDSPSQLGADVLAAGMRLSGESRSPGRFAFNSR